MKIAEGIRQTFEVIASNKIRSFLTMLGINFGVGSLIAISIVGLSFRTSISGEMGKFGSNLIWVRPNRDAYVRGEHRVLLRESDVDFFNRYLPGLVYKSTILNRWVKVRYHGKGEDVSVFGVSPDYFSIFAIKVAKGRAFVPEDIRLHRKVCVIRPDIAEDLFGDTDPIGKQISMLGHDYTVVGLTERLERGFLSDGSDNSTIFIPSSYMARLIWGGREIKYWIYLMRFDSMSNVDNAIDRIDNYLINRYGYLRGEKRFRIDKMDSYIKIVDRVLNVISMLILVIASISLVVGGLGIMNIMLVTVTERTREIGIRMAVGANSRDILVQFMIEAITLCLLGGGVGVVFGVGIAALACSILKWNFLMNILYVLFALGISTLIGLVFGIYPAYKASKMMPVDALRIE